MAFLSNLWKKGTTEPLADDIPEAGLAIDVANQKAYSKDNAGNIFEIGKAGIPEPSTPDIAHGREVDGTGVGSWQPVVKEAPIDGRPYARKDAAWDDLTDDFAQKANDAEFQTHLSASNPHSINPGTIGLGNVSDLDPAGQVDAGLTTPGETSVLGRYSDGNFDWAKLRNSSAGVPDANSVVLLNGVGQIDPSMIDTSIFYLVGAWDPSDPDGPADDDSGCDPTLGCEYPDVTGEAHGAFWFINALSVPDEPVEDPPTYTFTTGELAGKTISTWDFMVWAANGWSIMSGQMNPLLYVKRDGSTPMVADFPVGDATTQHKVTYLADGVDPKDAVNVGQIGSLIGDFLPRDGSEPMEGNLDMGSHKIISLAPGTAVGEAVAFEQIEIGTY